MPRFILVLLLSMIVVAIIVGSSSALDQKTPQPVVVTNTNANPVPVTGDVNAAVSGNVNVNGTVNVGNMPSVTISNMPSVSINSMPSVTLGSGATVAIDPASTVQATNVTVRDIVRLVASLEGGGVSQSYAQSNRCTPACLADYYVPAGKRLVITNISGQVTVPIDTNPHAIFISTSDTFLNAFVITAEPHKLLQSTVQLDYYAFNSTGPMYVDPGQPIQIVSHQGAGASLGVFFQGYLVDCGGGCINSQ